MDDGVIVLLVASVTAIAVIVVAPWRRVRAEQPLPPAIEARLLLGDDPNEVARDDDAAATAALDSVPEPDVEPDVEPDEDPFSSL